MRIIQGGRLAVIGGALTLVLGSRLARADGPNSVAVFPYASVYGQVPQTAADKITDTVSSELAASNNGSDFKVQEIPGAKSAAPAEGNKEDPLAGARKTNQEAVAQLQKGMKLAQSKKFGPALAALDHGISAFLGSFQGADDFKELSDAYVQLALAQLRLGNDEKARRALDDLIRLDPERVLSPNDLPKELATLHAKRRAELFNDPRGSIRVDSVPAGARVAIDGRDLGETPLLAQGALSGDHYVRVSKEGFGAAWRRISVSDHQEKESFTLAQAQASGPLAEIGATLAKNTVDADLISAVQKIGDSAKADYVVFGGVRKNAAGDGYEVKTYALRSKDGAISELPDMAFDEELLSANIEVLKVVNDLTQKINEQTFTAAPGSLVLFEGVKAPRDTGAAAAVVVLAPAAVEGGEAAATGGEPLAPSHRRGPVTAAEPEVAAPVVTPTPEATGDEEGGSALEELKRRREQALKKAQEEQEAPKPAPAVETPSDENTSSEASPEDQGNKVDLSPKPSKSDMASLTPEDLEKMKEAEAAANKKPDNALAIGLGTAGAIVGAAAIALGVYFGAFYHPTATTASAHVTW